MKTGAPAQACECVTSGCGLRCVVQTHSPLRNWRGLRGLACREVAMVVLRHPPEPILLNLAHCLQRAQSRSTQDSMAPPAFSRGSKTKTRPQSWSLGCLVSAVSQDQTRPLGLVFGLCKMPKDRTRPDHRISNSEYTWSLHYLHGCSIIVTSTTGTPLLHFPDDSSLYSCQPQPLFLISCSLKNMDKQCRLLCTLFFVISFIN
jgi:hypothetical protein